jgi:3'-phosphoadenosine 5'-phosphosulfate sulfotransferase (PAPS reductase)/FAD synthetase
MSAPALRVLSLGAGVQSTTLLLLAAEGRLPHLDGAVFSDTGWEPAAVYNHLDRLQREVAEPAGIPIHRVSVGNIRDDALNPEAHFAQMPLYVRGHGGGEGMLRRACTAEYKVAPIKTQVRALLGYPRPARVPKGVFVEQWIGISSDESSRAARMSDDVQYMKSHFPLLYLQGGTGRYPAGWTRADCQRYLTAHGFPETPKSACIGCPYTGNARWRQMRDQRPEEWADAVDFDASIRHGNARAIATGNPLRGEAFLHRSRRPLDQAPIDRVTSHEWAGRQTDAFEQIADAEIEDDECGCSPWACRGEDDEEGAA